MFPVDKVFKYSTPATVRRDQPLLLDVRHDYAGRVSDPDPVGSDVSSEVGSGSGQYQTGSETVVAGQPRIFANKHVCLENFGNGMSSTVTLSTLFTDI